jgi:hypothetical protein
VRKCVPAWAGPLRCSSHYRKNSVFGRLSQILAIFFRAGENCNAEEVIGLGLPTNGPIHGLEARHGITGASGGGGK